MRLFAYLLLLLVPSAWFAYSNRDLPHFGDVHDDSLYYIGAKTFAEGKEYRILSLPGEPFQTKYPPLFPLYLSAAWRIDPQFPANLRWAALLVWLPLPALLFLSRRLYDSWDVAGNKRNLLLALLALNPYLIFFSTHMLSEMLFTCLAICVLLLLAAPSAGRWFAAGIAAGIAYLCRTAGIALGILAYSGRWQYLAGMAPFALGWLVWSKLHQSPGQDVVTLYYTNYAGYQLYNVHLSEFHIFLWKNIDGLLHGIGALFIPKIAGSLIVKTITQTIAVAAIAGTVRLFHREAERRYVLFAAAYAFLLVIWHFPPTERFVLPLFPLLALGLVNELTRVWDAIKKGFTHKDASQRAAARVMAAAGCALIAVAAAMQLYTTWFLMPAMMDQHRARLAAQKPAWEWIAKNVPATESVLADMDPLLYLYTNRKSTGFTVPPVFWYRDDRAATLAYFKRVAEFAKEHGHSKLLLTDKDFSRDMREDDHAEVMKEIKGNAGLVKLFEAGNAAVYEIK